VAATKDEKLTGNNLYVVLTLVTLLAVGITVLIGKALVGSISLDSKVVTAKNTAKNQLTSDVQAAPQLVEAYSSLGTQAQTLADALPNDSDFPGLIVTLENMTTADGLQLKSVSPTAAGTAAPIASETPTAGTSTTTSGVSAPAPQTYPFSVAFDGSYAGLLKLLGQVENSARPMRVVGIQLSGSGSAMSGEVDLQTFYQPAAQLPFGEETIK
jgi:hypothetical protein